MQLVFGGSSRALEVGEIGHEIRKHLYFWQILILNAMPRQALHSAIALDEQAFGLTKTYDITFVNEKSFLPHMTGLMSQICQP